MSLELALKAYLRHHGHSILQLKQLGHDLRAAYESARRCGLEHTGNRNFRVAILGKNYRRRRFAYPEESILDVILPWSLRQIANEIIKEVFSTIKGEDVMDGLQDQPGLSIASSYPEDVDASAWATSPAAQGIPDEIE